MHNTAHFFKLFTIRERGFTQLFSPFLVNCLAFLGIIGLSVFLSVFFIFPEMPKNKFLYDAGGYYYLSLDIENWGQFYSSIRTFGYPFFLYLVRQLAIATNTFPWLTFLFIVQFSIHTLTSFLTLGIYNHLLIKTQKQASPAWGFLIFALSQLNLVLLPFAFELLTENLSIFLFTLAIYWFTSENKHRFVFMGFALGLATLIRPFYGPLSLICGLAIILSTPHTTKSKSYVLRDCISRVLRFGIPFFLVCSPQFYLIYKHEHRFGLVGDSARRAGESHINLSPLLIKIEGHGLDQVKPLIVYWDEDRKRELKEESQGKSLLSFFLKNPWGSTRIALLKTIALFQNFEWSVYRKSHNIKFNHPGLLYGFLHFFLFINLILALVKMAHSEVTMRISRLGVLGGLLIVAHVFLYSILTVPESRYIAPALPALIALGSYSLSNISPRWRLFSALLACLSYVFTFNFLENSLHRTNFSELYNLIPK